MRIALYRDVFVPLTAFAAMTLATTAQAQTLTVQCHSDGPECEATEALARRFELGHPGVKILIDAGPDKSPVEPLATQAAGGEGPDIERITDLGHLGPASLDLRPYLSPARLQAWNDSFSNTLPWLRTGPSDQGIYGLMSHLTLTGAFVNKTLFEQARVVMPGPGASWDAWMAAAHKVAKATGAPFAMTMDRSGPGFAALAVAYGAKILDTKGHLTIDAGYRAAARKLLGWHKAGLLSREVWGKPQSRDAFEEFANARAVIYYSGSWQLRRMNAEVSRAFDWIVVPAPCGPAACTATPGGAVFVARKWTRQPALAARFLDFLAEDANYLELTARAGNIPASQTVAKAGVSYDNMTADVKAGLAVFAASVPKIAPINFSVQGDRLDRMLFQPTVQRLGQSVAGEISPEEALKRLTTDVDEQLRVVGR
ncbi:MAG TPA: ABC transporter substrate-binding protein [Burkholderiaceae bacterium]